MVQRRPSIAREKLRLSGFRIGHHCRSDHHATMMNEIVAATGGRDHRSFCQLILITLSFASYFGVSSLSDAMASCTVVMN